MPSMLRDVVAHGLHAVKKNRSPLSGVLVLTILNRINNYQKHKGSYLGIGIGGQSILLMLESNEFMGIAGYERVKKSREGFKDQVSRRIHAGYMVSCQGRFACGRLSVLFTLPAFKVPLFPPRHQEPLLVLLFQKHLLHLIVCQRFILQRFILFLTSACPSVKLLMVYLQVQ